MGSTTRERVLDWTPPPHFSEQREKPDHWDTLQSMGQRKVLQDLDWKSLDWQALPPWAGVVTMERVRN
jgi:hypothetical protein